MYRLPRHNSSLRNEAIMQIGMGALGATLVAAGHRQTLIGDKKYADWVRTERPALQDRWGKDFEESPEYLMDIYNEAEARRLNKRPKFGVRLGNIRNFNTPDYYKAVAQAKRRWRWGGVGMTTALAGAQVASMHTSEKRRQRIDRAYEQWDAGGRQGELDYAEYT